MQERNYAKRAWALLTRDKGWIKPVLVMAAASLVPIAGPLGVSGYALEWARLTAWGVDASPKQKDVQVGTCIRSGWRACVVGIGWGLCLGIVIGIINFVTGVIPGVLGDLIQVLTAIAFFVAELFLMVAIVVAEIRTAIYERIGAGFRADRIWEMIRRDTKGFVQLVLFTLAWGIVAAIVSFIIMLVIGLAFVPVMISSSYTSSEYAMMMALSQTIGIVIVLALVFGYAFSIFVSGYMLVFYNAVALWMRQFDVPSWGRSEDPLPDVVFDSYETGMPQQPVSPQGPEVSQRPEPGMGERPASVQQDSVPHAWEEVPSAPAPVIAFETAPTQADERESVVEPVSSSGPELVVEPMPAQIDEEVQTLESVEEDESETGLVAESVAEECPSVTTEQAQSVGNEPSYEEQLEPISQDESTAEPAAPAPTIRLSPAPTQRLDRAVDNAMEQAVVDEAADALSTDPNEVDDLYGQLYDVMHRDDQNE